MEINIDKACTLQVLQLQLETQQKLLSNYLDLSVEQIDDEAYVARGNGFCDSKYSDDFIESQIAAIQQRISGIQQQIAAVEVQQ